MATEYVSISEKIRSVNVHECDPPITFGSLSSLPGGNKGEMMGDMGDDDPFGLREFEREVAEDLKQRKSVQPRIPRDLWEKFEESMAAFPYVDPKKVLVRLIEMSTVLIERNGLGYLQEMEWRVKNPPPTLIRGEPIDEE